MITGLDTVPSTIEAPTGDDADQHLTSLPATTTTSESTVTFQQPGKQQMGDDASQFIWAGCEEGASINSNRGEALPIESVAEPEETMYSFELEYAEEDNAGTQAHDVESSSLDEHEDVAPSSKSVSQRSEDQNQASSPESEYADSDNDDENEAASPVSDSADPDDSGDESVHAFDEDMQGYNLSSDCKSSTSEDSSGERDAADENSSEPDMGITAEKPVNDFWNRGVDSDSSFEWWQSANGDHQNGDLCDLTDRECALRAFPDGEDDQDVHTQSS